MTENEQLTGLGRIPLTTGTAKRGPARRELVELRGAETARLLLLLLSVVD